MPEEKDAQSWKDFEFQFRPEGHTFSVLEGRDSLSVNTEHGVALVTFRNDDGSTREKQIIWMQAGVVLIERPRVQKPKPLPAPSDGPAKVVSIGGQPIN